MKKTLWLLLAAGCASPAPAPAAKPEPRTPEAAVEIQDPAHPARVLARDYKLAFAARLTEAASEHTPDRCQENSDEDEHTEAKQHPMQRHRLTKRNALHRHHRRHAKKSAQNFSVG